MIHGAPLTAQISEFVYSLDPDRIPRQIRDVASLCLLDWLGCAMAGAQTPTVAMMRSVLGRPQSANVTPLAVVALQHGRMDMADAVLLDGIAGHVLDYDDSARSMHVTAPIAPALLALTTKRRVSGSDLIAALVAGAETELELDRSLSPHLDRGGWHVTSTLGTFGAAVACGRLLDLPQSRFPSLLGLAGVQAAGLMWAFGSDAKAFQVGKSASNGLLAAMGAAHGLRTGPDVLEQARGFAQTHCRRDIHLEPPPLFDGYSLGDVLFKFHASCHGTHAVIEGLVGLLRERRIHADDVRHIELSLLDPIWNIDVPTTGVEAKFSARACAAFAILGHDTADLNLYADESLRDPRYQEMVDRIVVCSREDKSADGWTRALIRVTRTDGSQVVSEYDVTSQHQLSHDSLRDGVVSKFLRLADPIVGPARAREIKEYFLALPESGDDFSLLQVFPSSGFG